MYGMPLKRTSIIAVLSILLFCALIIFVFEVPFSVDSSTSVQEESMYDTASATTSLSIAPLLKEIEMYSDEEVALTIDSELQEQIYEALETIAFDKGYKSGAGVVMNVETGELVSLVSYSEEATTTNMATRGLFVPGSIIKPFIAMAALSEDIIDPKKEILSTGSITLVDRNGVPRVFNDWRAHGLVDMEKAIGVSSNVYFYAIGGGYEDQQGLGIEKITEYLELFGIGEKTGIAAVAEGDGQTPTPEWKAAAFGGDEWRLGDTYLASIGQHGYAVTPLQMTRAVAAIATEGEMVTPRIVASAPEGRMTLPLPREHFKIVKGGMEYAVLSGTASGLYMDGVTLAAKTGTAEADSRREHIHSWIIGYFPHDAPRYAFTFMLASGPWGEETGAVAVAQDIFIWMREHRPDLSKK